MAVDQINLAVIGRTKSNSFGRKSSWETCALACGIAFVALLFTSFFIGPEPLGADAPAAQVLDTYVKHHDVALVQAYLRSITAFLMFIFVTGMASVARRAEGRFSIPSVLAIGSALAFSLVMFISQMADATAVVLAGRGVQAETVLAMSSLGDTMRHLNAISYALVLGAVSAALLRARVVPRLVGWLGLAGGLLFLAAAAGFPATRLGAISLMALPFMPLLALLLSVTLLARSYKEKSETLAHD